jgi:tetratricopeptide (TPR) repeat protein
MATLLAYLAWLRHRRVGRYLALVGCFALGLAAKPMLVSLPVVLLLLDRWPLGRLKGWPEVAPRLAEKLPLIVMAGASSAITAVAQRRGGAMVFLDALPLGNRLANATVGCAGYLRMMLFPKGLAVIYPLDEELPALAAILGSLALLAALTAAAVAGRRRQPWLGTGWGWYLVTLLPVIGLVQVGQQAVADRYTYLPSAGIALGLVWWLAARPLPWRRRALLGAAALAWLLVMAGLTVRQISFWRDSETLFRRALAVTRGNHVALNNLGLAMTKEGRRDEAKAFYRQIIAKAPNYASARVNLAVLLIEDGELEEAREHLERTVARYPDSPEAHYNLGAIALREGDLAGARREFEAALDDRPDDPRSLNNLGSLALRAGDRERAGELFARAIAADPRYPEALNNLGTLRGEAGRDDAARELFLRALRQDPASARALYGLGVLELRRGDAARARDLFGAALAARPGMPEAERALAILAGEGR